MGATTELKILSDNGTSFRIGGYGVVFGGHDASSTKDRFTAETDFWFDRITATPMVMYQHGQDGVLKRSVVGRVTSTKPDSIGLWVEAQITAAKQYADAIRQLVAKGVLGWSSGSVPHLVERVKSATPGVHEITSWPIVELSLTPTPAEPRTVGVKELKSLAAADPLLLPIAREAEQAELKEALAVPELPDSAFAFIESGGTLDDAQKTFPRLKRHYPHHDATGDVDADALKSASAAASSEDEHVEAIAHLWLHTHADELGHDHAHESVWAKGMAPIQLVAGLRLTANAFTTAEQQSAMALLKTDTKSGMRMQPDSISRANEIVSEVGRHLNDAETIERGQDEQARVEFYRTQLALLEVGRA